MQDGLTDGRMWKEEWWEERRRKIIQFPFLEFNMITWRWSFNRLVNNSEPLGSTHLLVSLVPICYRVCSPHNGWE